MAITYTHTVYPPTPSYNIILSLYKYELYYNIYLYIMDTAEVRNTEDVVYNIIIINSYDVRLWSPISLSYQLPCILYILKKIYIYNKTNPRRPHLQSYTRTPLFFYFFFLSHRQTSYILFDKLGRNNECK